MGSDNAPFLRPAIHSEERLPLTRLRQPALDHIVTKNAGLGAVHRLGLAGALATEAFDSSTRLAALGIRGVRLFRVLSSMP